MLQLENRVQKLVKVGSTEISTVTIASHGRAGDAIFLPVANGDAEDSI